MKGKCSTEYQVHQYLSEVCHHLNEHRGLDVLLYRVVAHSGECSGSNRCAQSPRT